MLSTIPVLRDEFWHIHSYSSFTLAKLRWNPPKVNNGGHAGVAQFPEVGQYHFSLLIWDFFPYLSMCLRIFEEKNSPTIRGYNDAPDQPV